MFCRRIVNWTIVAILWGANATAQQPPWIFGMHDPGAEGEMEAKGKRGWVVFTEAIGRDPNDRIGKDFRFVSSRGHGVIVRLNHGYEGAGNLPFESQYGEFAQRVANYIQSSQGADIYILGNETNLPREWPGNVNGDPNSGEAITPARYVSCYNQVYAELQRRGLTNKILVPAPTGTWAPPYDGTLAHLPNRGVPGFMDYWVQVLNALGPAKVGGLAIHAYTHGSDPNLIYSTQKMGWPYQDIFYHFQVYKNFMARVPSSFRQHPMWITEADESRDQQGYNWDPDSRTIQWIRNAFAEINAWNTNTSNQKIRSLVLFRWPDVWEGDRNYCVSCVGTAVEGFRQAMNNDYRWTDGSPPPPPTGGNNADILRANSSIPGSVPAGEGRDVIIRVQNTGGTTWSAGMLYRLGATATNQFHLEGFQCGGYSQSPADARVFLCSDVAPGQTAELRFRVRPAVSSGTAKLSLRMVRDGVAWFGDNETWDIPVDSAPPPGCGNADFPAPADRYKLEIWKNRTMTGTPVERRTEFPGTGGFEKNWGDGGASGCTGNDNFSIRFSRRFEVSTSGTYRFTTTTDDGVRLYIDGALIIDQWKDQPPTSFSGAKTLSAGAHDLRMDYYENGGGAYAKLEWRLEAPAPGGNEADILRVESSVPSSISADSSQEVLIRIANTGGTTWTTGSTYRLGSTSANQFHFEGFPCGGYSQSPTNGRVYLCQTVAPGQTAELRFHVRPAISSGTAKLSFRMVQDGVEWFGDTETWDVSIDSNIPPPSNNRLTNADFQNGTTGWTLWNERGNANASVVNGRLQLSGDFNGGVYQQFSTGGGRSVVDISGFWSGNPSSATARWAEVLVINGSRVPVDGHDVNGDEPDVVLIYKNDTRGGWSGTMSQTAPVANVGSFMASGDVATIVLKGGSWQGTTTTSFDDLVAASSAIPPAPPPSPTAEKLARIGFHVGPGGNQTGLSDWMRRLDAAGIPFFLKSVDSGGQLLEAARLREVSGVPHVLVYRATRDVPDYNLPPEESARNHWQLHRSVFPPELLPYRHWIWLETVNEIDKNRSEWLGRFSHETALLAMNEGFRWAAFGWSSGEPEPHHWEGPEMLRFLRLAAENPDQVAIALHEYSFTIDAIDNGFPYLVGRFQKLFDTADRNGFERPTVLITEWGWEYNRVPDPTRAMQHIQWADMLYAEHPQIRGAAIWYLGPGFGGISDLAQRLIEPVTELYLQQYGGATSGTELGRPRRSTYAPFHTEPAQETRARRKR